MDTKELKQSVGLGVIFAVLDGLYNYAVSGKKPTVTASADVIYDYGKAKKWWPWV